MVDSPYEVVQEFFHQQHGEDSQTQKQYLLT